MLERVFAYKLSSVTVGAWIKGIRTGLFVQANIIIMLATIMQGEKLQKSNTKLSSFYAHWLYKQLPFTLSLPK